MTVNNTNIVSGPYIGNGITTEFSYDFRVDDKTQLEIYETDSVGIVTPLILDVDYTVNSVGSDSGGTITRIAGALPLDYKWIIKSNYKLTQEISFSSQGGFFPDIHEKAIDKLTVIAQQLSEEIDRCIKVDITSDIDPDELIQSIFQAEINTNNDAVQTALDRITTNNDATQTAIDRIATGKDVVSSQTVLDSVVTTGDTQVARVIIEGDTQDARLIAEGDTQVARIGDFVPTFDTVDELTQLLGDNSFVGTCLVKDLARGGTFVYDATKVAEDNQGTNFNGWIRQYDGAANVKWFGVVGGGVVDDTASLQHAALISDNLYVGNDSYLITDKILLREGQVWTMDNPEFVQNGVDFTTVFEASDIADWAILGRTRCSGTLVTSLDVGAEKGLVIKGCSRYRVEAFTTTNMRSHGIHMQAGTLTPSPRGDQGQLTDCACNEGRVGIEIDADTSAEFNVFSNFNASGNIDGAIVGAGNSTFIGGNIVDNTRGVTLIAGSNHAHGGFVGTQINHNNTYNLKTVSVLNGHTFTGCHFYGNGGSTAPIWFENSKGVNINGGVIDCAIRCDGTTGQNAITNNYIPSTTPSLFGTNKEFLRILGNWNDGGLWDVNDTSSEYSQLSRATSGQLVSPGGSLIFNNAEKDKRISYNTGTGVYTARTAGSYKIKIALLFTGSGFIAAGSKYVEIKKNTTAIAFTPVVPVSDGVSVGSGVVNITLAIGDTITIISQVVGTAVTLGITSSRLSIELT